MNLYGFVGNNGLDRIDVLGFDEPPRAKPVTVLSEVTLYYGIAKGEYHSPFVHETSEFQALFNMHVKLERGVRENSDGGWDLTTQPDIHVSEVNGMPSTFSFRAFYKKEGASLEGTLDTSSSRDLGAGYCVACESWSGWLAPPKSTPMAAVSQVTNLIAGTLSMVPGGSLLSGAFWTGSGITGLQEDEQLPSVYFETIVCADLKRKVGIIGVPLTSNQSVSDIEVHTRTTGTYGAWVHANPGGKSGLLTTPNYSANE